MKQLMFFLVFSMGLLLGAHQSYCERVFSRIYESGQWGKDEQGRGISGFGSTPENTIAYVECITDFFKKHSIRSVVDAGCGDWMFSRYMNWKGIDYIGIDVYGKIIDRNNQEFANDHICFIKGDILQMTLPKADLLLCKDVLMHLSNASIIQFLEKTKKFKFCLITNNFPNKGQKFNYNIRKGSGRKLDLSKPPFNVRGKSLLRYRGDECIKEVFLIIN